VRSDVVPRETAVTVAAAARQRLDKEAATHERLRAGELGVDLDGLRQVLAERGVEWIEE
jgi:4-hydroxy-4-methyl-2-oxoglutarate aldolase